MSQILKRCGIYRISQIGTDRVYVGQSVDLVQRRGDHFKTLRKGKHASRYLQNAFKKYGEDAFVFEILEEGFDPIDKTTLTAAEQKWMDELKPCFNVAPAAASQAGLVYDEKVRAKMAAAIRKRIAEATPEERGKWKAAQQAAMTPEVYAKIGAARKGQTTWMKGKKHSEESLAKLSASKKGQPSAWKGKSPSAEMRAKMSAAKKGKPSTYKGKQSPMRGVPRSDEIRAKISAAHLARQIAMSDEQKQAQATRLASIAGHMKGKPWPAARRAAFLQMNTGS